MRCFFAVAMLLLAQPVLAGEIKDAASEPMKNVISVGCMRASVQKQDTTEVKFNPTQEQWKSYCDCSAGKFVNELTDEEFMKFANRELTIENPDIRRKLNKSGLSCIDKLVQ